MIKGLGIDVVEVSRIEGAMKNPRFARRILTDRECDRPLTPAYVAGRWAAKEAVAKAVGLGLRWQDIEILSAADGKPRVWFIGPIQIDDKTVLAPSALFRAEEISEQIQLSISHERGIAAAVAIWEELP
ncbi:MAG: holo-ACP synthase [Fimbriimonadales bacterium]